MKAVPHRWAEQREICRAILCGNPSPAFDRYRVSELDRTIYERMTQDALDQLIRRRSPARFYFRAQIKNPIWFSTLLSAAIGVSALASASYLSVHVDLSDDKTLPILGSVAAFCAIAVAAIGWGVAGWIAHRNNRSKYTLDTVAARYSQPAFSDALRHFNRAFKDRRVNTAMVEQLASSKDTSDQSAVQGLRCLLNYFEFISVGILQGELDERIVAKTLRGNLLFVYQQSAAYIRDLQRNNPKTLEHFTLVSRHFQEL